MGLNERPQGIRRRLRTEQYASCQEFHLHMGFTEATRIIRFTKNYVTSHNHIYPAKSGPKICGCAGGFASNTYCYFFKICVTYRLAYAHGRV